jgi:serine/threonine protein kinase/tetratricopeptide (TPR) repeat protein
MRRRSLVFCERERFVEPNIFFFSWFGDTQARMKHDQQIGLYRLISPLGEGGMGTVWRAEHVETRELVALKTVRLVEGNLLRSLRREVRAIARLSHPNIVKIIDEGEHLGNPYYVMELIVGQTLGAWRRNHKGDTAAALQVVYQLCDPLAYLHGEGLVYRDLKPDNILIRSDGTPVLVDFGLASVYAEQHREVLSIEHKFVGTPAYMAPEQILGEPLDARCDLYALGVILYELLTDERPFTHKSPLSVMKMHLQSPPPALSTKRPGLPPGVEVLVGRLLAKRRQERVGYAQDVAQALLALGVTPQSSGVQPRPYLYRPSCAGRTSQLAQLTRRTSQLKQSQGGLILLGGESGAGKTRIAAEVVRSLEQSQINVMTSSCEEGVSMLPLEAFRAVLRALCDYCREFGQEATEHIFGTRGRVLGFYEPSIRSLPGQDQYPEPSALPPEIAKQRLFVFLAETLFAFSERKPLFLLIDDLQWADALSFGFLEFFLKGGLLSQNMLILALYRKEEETEHIKKLSSAESTTKILLPRLDAAAVTQIVSDMLALPEVPPYFASYIAAESEGNPFFVAEYLQLSIEEQLLLRDQDGKWRMESDEALRARQQDPRLPRGLSALLSRRLSGLSADEKQLAEAASVLGRISSAALLLDVSRLTEHAFGEALRELTRRQILEEQGEQISFVHDKLREACYRGLSPERQLLLHTAAAKAIEEIDEENFAALGFHWERAGERLPARRSYLRAAENAEALYDTEQARSFYQLYLNLLEGQTRASIAVRIRFAEKILLVRGEAAEAARQLEIALQDAREIGATKEECEALRHMGFSHLRLNRPELCESLYGKSLALARRISDITEEAYGLQALAAFYFEQGRLQEAREPFLRALEIYQTTKNRQAEGTCLGNLAGLYFNQGHIEDARQLFHQAILLHQETGNLRSESNCVNNLGVIAHGLGQFQEAISYCQQALALAKQTGDRRLEGICLANLSNDYLAYQQIEQAKSTIEEALLITRRLGEKRLEAVYLANLANICFLCGQIEITLEHYQQALALSRQVQDQRTEGICSGELAAVLLLCFGKQEATETLLQRADEVLSQMGDVVEQGRVRCVRGHLLLSRAEPIEEILREVEAIADKSKDLSEALDALKLASEAQRQGKPLRNGFLASTLHAELQAWLSKAQ